jgi:anti-repressor protein
MNSRQLIPVTPGQLNGQATQLVDARLLHGFLEVGRDYSTWIKGRIQEYDFVVGEDYLVIKRQRFDSPKRGNQNGRGGDHRSVDYFLTLDMAKELAMVERTPRGRQARRYFIDCEQQLRRLQQASPSAVQACAVDKSRAQRQAVNRQAWADVAGKVYAEFHARREQLIRQYQGLQPWVEDGIVYLPRGFRPQWAL